MAECRALDRKNQRVVKKSDMVCNQAESSLCGSRQVNQSVESKTLRTFAPFFI